MTMTLEWLTKNFSNFPAEIKNEMSSTKAYQPR